LTGVLVAGRSFAETVEVTWATSSWMGVPWEANPGDTPERHCVNSLSVVWEEQAKAPRTCFILQEKAVCLSVRESPFEAVSL
ncbi:unnamed protein product, partial [Symbiodinium pilosum]